MELTAPTCKHCSLILIYLLMHIEVIFDTVCPWCFLGKRRLEKALHFRPNINPKITWSSFLLNPNVPLGGIDHQDYLNAKIGNEIRASQIYSSIENIGKSLGIDFRFDKLEKIPNTLDAHRLIRYSSRLGCGSEMVESLFQAYFIKGFDTGNRTVLFNLAEEMGFNRSAIRGYFYSNKDIEDIRGQNIRAQKIGINGVPAFIIDGQISISGAQEPQVIGRLLEVAEERRRQMLSNGIQPV